MILTILQYFFGLVGLGIMVFVHELGHFVAAKLNGVAVEVFSLGWGPRLVGFTYRGTSYQISWFPIGGYCKMKGELAPGIAGGRGNAIAEAVAGTTEVSPVLEKGSFLAAAPWRRIIIAAFGPLFNLVFALLVFAMLWWAGFAVYSPGNRVILAADYTLDPLSQSSPAAVAGLRTGDRVTAIDGAPVEKFQDILETVSIAPGRKFLFTIQRAANGAEQTLVLPITPELDKSSGAGKIGVYAWVDPVLDTVQAGSGAAIAGLRKGDRLLRANARLIRNSIDFSQELASKPEKVNLAYEREGEQTTVALVLKYNERGDSQPGFDFAAIVYRSPRMGLEGALKKSVEETWSTVSLTVKGIGLLFQGVQLRKAVAGPLRIIDYIGTAATSGLQVGFGAGVVSFFRFLSFLSVVLFLMNLLPIPAMDGGQIVLFIVEVARGKALHARLIWRLQVIGFTLLLALFLVVTFNDILFKMGR
jgi:regulator of sigma E protease